MKFCFFVLLVSALFSCHQVDNDNAAPDCQKKMSETRIHNRVLVDHYAWLKNREDSTVRDYLKAENAYVSRSMISTKSLQENLYQELLGRINETDNSVPYKKGKYLYYSKTYEGKDHPAYYRKMPGSDREELLIDANDYLKKTGYYDAWFYDFSDTEKYMSIGVDKSGNFEETIYFFESSNKNMPIDSLQSVGTIEFSGDDFVYYSIQDSITNRNYRILKHRIGSDQSKDELIYEEKNNIYDVYIGRSTSRDYLYIISSSKSQNEIMFKKVGGDDDFESIIPRESEHKYNVYHQGEYFYVLSNKNAKNFKMIRSKVSDLGKDSWETIIEHRPDVYLRDITVHKEFLVLTEGKLGVNRFRVLNMKQNIGYYIDFDEESYVANPRYDPDYESDAFRYYYASLKTPFSSMSYNLVTKEVDTLKTQEIPSGFNSDDYISERLWAKAEDGKEVPISIVYKKDLVKDGSAPLFITGYGSYGSPRKPYFSRSAYSYIDRGFVYAIAHVRGGDDLGRHWYEDGKLLNKKNTFNDFIACIEHLIKHKYTSEGKVVARGASAGGLLMGVLVNERPELFNSVLLDVPFVDVINTMLDSTLPLTTGEYEEWGNPNIKEYFEYIYSYSPYDNIKKQEYPHMLFRAGLTDEQVGFWEPAKMVAKLRDYKTDDNKLLFLTTMSGGHAGPSGRYAALRETAFDQAFVLSNLGIKE